MTSGIVAVDELTRAFQALRAGEFRHGRRRPPATTDRATVAGRWLPAPDTTAVLVLGCIGSAGASTVALGLATAVGQARVVECCTAAASGLAAASSVELGPVGDGWVRGSRGPVLIERRADRVAEIDLLPVPPAATAPLCVVDGAFETAVVLAGAGWLGELARSLPAVVLVTRPSVPGVRRLEVAAGLVGAERVQAVVVGVDRRWPKPVEQATGPVVRRLRGAGRVTCVPFDAVLAVGGLSPEPLPAAVVASLSDLVTTLKGTC